MSTTQNKTCAGNTPKNAYQQASLRESQKTFSERLTEPITGFLGVAKGVGKSALKLLEFGWHGSPVGMTVDQCLEIKKQITDPVGWKSEKEAQVLALQQKVLEVWNAPEGITNHLLENAKDSVADHTVHFLNASQFERIETFGELAGDIAPFFIGVGEAKATSEVMQVGEELKLLEATSIKAERGLLTFKEKELEKHFLKHMNEWSGEVLTQEQYLIRANNLIYSEESSVLVLKRANGDLLKYNQNTNEFVVKTNQGVIRTFFRPKEGFLYWFKEVKR